MDGTKQTIINRVTKKKMNYNIIIETNNNNTHMHTHTLKRLVRGRPNNSFVTRFF